MDLDTIITFDEYQPYSRSVLEARQDLLTVIFSGIANTVVDYLPSSIIELQLYDSENVTFSCDENISLDIGQIIIKNSHNVTFNCNIVVDFVMLYGVSSFNDHGILSAIDMYMDFNIQLSDFQSRYLHANQLTLRNTNRLRIRHRKLDVDSLRNINVTEMRLTKCTSYNDGAFILPRLANVQRLTIIPEGRIPGDIHLTNIPESLQILRVPWGELSDQALDMIHSHTQRLRYINGQNSVTLQVIEIEAEYDDSDDEELQDFTNENRRRDTMADEIEREVNELVLPAPLHSQIMQYVYGDHYSQPRNGGSGTKKKKRTNTRQKKKKGTGKGKAMGRRAGKSTKRRAGKATGRRA